MKKVKMYFGSLTIPEKIQKARNLVAHMDANENFPNPEPPLAELITAANVLEKAYEEALNGGRIQIAAMRQSAAVLNMLVVSLAGYVQCVSRGDESIILSSGFEVQNPKSPSRAASTPEHVNGAFGNHEGEVELRWNKVRGSKAYNIEISLDGLSDWKPCGTATRARLFLKGLESGVKYFFRVAAIGPLGQSGWSDPGLAKAL